MNSQNTTYKLVRSFRRTLTLQVNDQGELVVKAPQLLPIKNIDEFIRQKESWIAKQKLRVGQSKKEKHSFESGDLFYYLGEKYPLWIDPKFNKRVSLQDGAFRTSLGSKREVRNAMIFWYKKKAREILELRLMVKAREMDLVFDKMRLSSARTRWGSCSSRRTISLNWKLIMAPLVVIDYVIVHEIGHLKHANHSKNFWNFVGEFCPDYKKLRKWLKVNGEKFAI